MPILSTMEVDIMSFIRIKKLNGKKYKFLVKGIRDGEKVRQKVVKYLGPVNPIYKTGFRRKTNASIFVRKLTDEEKNKIKTHTFSNNAFTKDRAKIILMSSEGLFSRQIAEKVSCDERKVWKAIKTFNNEGINSLQRKKAKGAKPKFTKEDKMVILIHFSKSPREFEVPISAWTLPRFREHLMKNKIVESISIEKIRQILLHAGAKLNRSKRWQYSPDKNFLRKRG